MPVCIGAIELALHRFDDLGRPVPSERTKGPRQSNSFWPSTVV
jgi:hypothetical protein